MKVKVSELEGAALDWAVAKCEGMDPEIFEYGGVPCLRFEFHLYSPSSDWFQAGLIIEQEKISIDFDGSMWCASDNEKPVACFAETPLIAAMRCYVASELGDEVDVPDELL